MRWIRSRPLVVDLLVACFVVVLSVIVVLSFMEQVGVIDGMRNPTTWWEWLLVVGPAWALPARRVAPTLAVITGGLIQAVVWGLELPDFYLSMSVLLYSATAYGSARGRNAGWSVVAVLTVWTFMGTLAGVAPVFSTPIVAGSSGFALWLGTLAADAKAVTQAAEAKAIDLLRTRNIDRERAVVEERARIARELHDVVAHGLSVIVVQAAAAQRIIDRDPGGASEALHQIEQTGRNSLSEMRHVLAAIRTEPEESWQPTPGLGALEELVDELSATGLRVTVTDRTEELTGHETAGQIRHSIPATVDVTAFRIVQEALTNVLKHAGRGAKASVDILRRSRALDLEIVDDGQGVVAGGGDGLGLRGMQERVEVFGGRFAAGPKPGGGFAVSVTLPFEARETPDSRDRAGTP